MDTFQIKNMYTFQLIDITMKSPRMISNIKTFFVLKYNGCFLFSSLKDVI